MFVGHHLLAQVEHREVGAARAHVGEQHVPAARRERQPVGGPTAPRGRPGARDPHHPAVEQLVDGGAHGGAGHARRGHEVGLALRRPGRDQPRHGAERGLGVDPARRGRRAEPQRRQWRRWQHHGSISSKKWRKQALFGRCTALVNPPTLTPMAALLTMRGIVKQFPGVRALDGVDLDVAAGEVHCLLGQNGAGKSTLIKVLAGAHRPDAGEITFDGQPVTFASPQAADQAGIATIYQELDLVPGLTRGGERRPRPRARPPRLHPAARRRGARPAQLLRRLGHPEIPARRELGRLSAAGQQVVSMARALARDARLIVMDEPSAVLDPDEVREPVPGDPRADRGRRRGRLHLAPARGDPPDRRPGHGAQGRPHGGPQPAGAATPRPPR